MSANDSEGDCDQIFSSRNHFEVDKTVESAEFIEIDQKFDSFDDFQTKFQNLQNSTFQLFTTKMSVKNSRPRFPVSISSLWL